jgi:hypothetical protein
MGLAHGVNIVNNGLVFYADPMNPRSWTGPDSSTVNDLISTPTGSISNDTSGSYGDNKSFAFDGADDRIDFGTASSRLISTSPYTFSAWVKVTDNDNMQTILSTTNGDDSGYKLEINTGLAGFTNITFYNQSDTKSIRCDFSSYNSWQNIVVVRNGTSNNKIYINTIPQTLTTNTENLANPSSTFPLVIGAQYFTSYYRNLNGNMGPLQIYNKALSAQEVTQNYNALKSRFGL